MLIFSALYKKQVYGIFKTSCEMALDAFKIDWNSLPLYHIKLL